MPPSCYSVILDSLTQRLLWLIIPLSRRRWMSCYPRVPLTHQLVVLALTPAYLLFISVLVAYGPHSLMRKAGSGVATAFSHSSGGLSSLGSSRSGPVGIPTYQSMSVILLLWKSTTSGNLGLNAFNHHWTYQVSYVFPPPLLFPLVLSMFLAKNVTGQFRPVTLLEPCCFWGSLPSHRSQHAGRCSSTSILS